MIPMTIGMDVDDVVADLITEWLRVYNTATGDALLAEDIEGWSISNQAQRMSIEAFFQIIQAPHFYEGVSPIPGARTAIYKLLGAGHRVVYVSSCIGDTMAAKQDWLVRYGFLTKHNRMRDFIAANDKSLVTGIDVLFDDRIKNVEEFPGNAYLVDSPHNRGQACSRLRVRVDQIPMVVNGLAQANSPYKL